MDTDDILEETEDAESPGNMHKTSPYVRTVVALHNLRERAKESLDSFQERSIADRMRDTWSTAQSSVKQKTRNFFTHPENASLEHIPDKYGYVFRPKSYWEMILLGGTVCGIEFCYSAETAFVTPILLSLGLKIKFVTMIWCLSPLVGLFVTPVLGSMSDSCESRMGRRRPFILLYSIGILLGLILVPNGHTIGLSLGDTSNVEEKLEVLSNSSLLNETYAFINTQKVRNITRPEAIRSIRTQGGMYSNSGFYGFNDTLGTKDVSEVQEIIRNLTIEERKYKGMYGNSHLNRTFRKDGLVEVLQSRKVSTDHVQPWSIVFTVIGTILLDFCSDACQSPSRTFLLDVSLPTDHAAGLSTFTLMAGLGGSVGYAMGAINWDDTFLGNWLGGHVHVVFTIVTLVFIACLISTLCSFPEIPLSVLRDPKMFKEYQEKLQAENCHLNATEMIELEEKPAVTYGATEKNKGHEASAAEDQDLKLDASSQNIQVAISTEEEKGKVQGDIAAQLTTGNAHPTLKDFLKSIIQMPKSLRILCLTNLFCWMSLVCYSLYFTDFVAECVFEGDPMAPEDSESYALYEDGVRFGCLGMALYSFSCAIYSYFIEALVKKIGAKPTYIGGQLVYSAGMIIMAITRHKVAVILLSPTAGVMYATLFTMPYLLIAHYHSTNKFSDESKGIVGGVRGIGTDVAAVSSMVFLSQFILSMTMGSIVEAVGSNVATMCAAALLSGCGALSASQVLYLDV